MLFVTYLGLQYALLYSLVLSLLACSQAVVIAAGSHRAQLHMKLYLMRSISLRSSAGLCATDGM